MRAPTPALVAALTLIAPLATWAQAAVDESRPFAPGERLDYAVSFGPFRAPGTGTLRVEGPEACRAGEPCVLLRFDIEAIIGGQRVSHHARSWLSTSRFASLAYEMNEQSPLGRGTDRWQWPGAAAAGGTSLPLDEFSFIYLLRTLSLPEDSTLRLDRHHDATRNPVQVRMLRRQVMALGGLPVRTVQVELRVRDPQRFQGGEGTLRIHFTDDAARIPVRLGIASPLGPDLVLAPLAAVHTREERAMRMNTSTARKLALLAAVLGSLGAAPDGTTVPAQAKLWVTGTSTVQPYRCTAKAVDARVTGLREEGPLTLASLSTAAGGSARVDVAALDCANDTMNEHLRNALQAKDHPQIRFEVKAYQLGATQGGRAKLSLDGALTIAGATRPVHLDATASERAGGQVTITGQCALDMKDYGVKPPELFFGAMKVNPGVVIGFELTLAAPAPAPVAAGPG